MSVKDIVKEQEFKLRQEWTWKMPEVEELLSKELSDVFSKINPEIIIRTENDLFSLDIYYFDKSLELFERSENCLVQKSRVCSWGASDFSIIQTRIGLD